LIEKNKKIRVFGLARKKLARLVWERDNYTCQNPYCRGRAPLARFPHHEPFKSRGGNDVPEDLVTLCMECDTLRHAEKLMIEKKNGKFVFSRKEPKKCNTDCGDCPPDLQKKCE
jgi:hypothetical protein